MSTNTCRHVYGPVASRRLGRSLGIDLVPFKTCTYDCIYCQLGRTTNKTVERKQYVAVEEVLTELERKLAAGDIADYISLAGSGEPTLHAGIGELIGGIKRLTHIPVAVLTNGSLLWMSEVQDALMAADLVMPSLDAGDESMFRHVNRPHRGISFERLVEGIAGFTKRFPGEVWLEVFLLAGVTSVPADAKRIADLCKRIGPSRVQLNTASRPPAEAFAYAVAPDRLEKLATLFEGTVEVISESVDTEAPALPRRPVSDEEILALLSRRPCTLQGVSSGLALRPGEVVKMLDGLSRQGTVRTVRRNGALFYEAARSA